MASRNQDADPGWPRTRHATVLLAWSGHGYHQAPSRDALGRAQPTPTLPTPVPRFLLRAEDSRAQAERTGLAGPRVPEGGRAGG